MLITSKQTNEQTNKKPFTSTSKLVFDQTPGHHIPAKSTHKINRHGTLPWFQGKLPENAGKLSTKPEDGLKCFYFLTDFLSWNSSRCNRRQHFLCKYRP